MSFICLDNYFSLSHSSSHKFTSKAVFNFCIVEPVSVQLDNIKLVILRRRMLQWIINFPSYIFCYFLKNGEEFQCICQWICICQKVYWELMLVKNFKISQPSVPKHVFSKILKHVCGLHWNMTEWLIPTVFSAYMLYCSIHCLLNSQNKTGVWAQEKQSHTLKTN